MPRSAAARPHGPSITLEQWAALDEDETGELVDGRLEEEEMPTYLHEAVVIWLIDVLRRWARRRGGWVFGSEAKLGVSPRRGRKSDVCMYLPGDRLPAAGATLSRHPPSVVIEIVSPRPRDQRRDRIDKRADYARFGVRWFWLVEPQLEIVEIFELAANGRYALALSAASGVHHVPGCPGLKLDLTSLWRELAKLPTGEGPIPAPPKRKRARR